MVKQGIVRSKLGSAQARIGGAVWSAVGRRLRQKRTELGFSIERVAQWAAVATTTYEGYENGAPIPASLLAQLAELYETPLVWFFEGVGEDDADDPEPAQSEEPVVYTVATLEHRIQALADSFRKLDFEGQQHLLALSRAMCRPSAAVAAK